MLGLIARGALRPPVSTAPLAMVNEVLGRLRRGEVEGRIALVP